MKDNIKPNHYKNKYEPYKVIKDWNLNFNLGNVVKYIARCGKKDNPIQELEKAKQYINFELEYLRGDNENEGTRLSN